MKKPERVKLVKDISDAVFKLYPAAKIDVREDVKAKEHNIDVELNGVSFATTLRSKSETDGMGVMIHWYGASKDLSVGTFGCVNEYHHRKATTFCDGPDDTLEAVKRLTNAVVNGKAFVDGLPNTLESDDFIDEAAEIMVVEDLSSTSKGSKIKKNKPKL